MCIIKFCISYEGYILFQLYIYFYKENQIYWTLVDICEQSVPGLRRTIYCKFYPDTRETVFSQQKKRKKRNVIYEDVFECICCPHGTKTTSSLH